MQYTLIAPCYFGTESVLSYEVKKLGAENVQVSDGKVTFTGDEHIIAAANINLRTAERVVILLKEFKAKTFDELFDGVYSINWAQLMPKDAQFPVKGSSLSSTLSSVPACQKIVKKAIVESMKKGHNTKVLTETGALYKIRVALRKDVVSVMLDTSGDGLHKRGYRRNSGTDKGDAGGGNCGLGARKKRQCCSGPVCRQRHLAYRGSTEGAEHCAGA